jgi:hypothetical protein
LLDPSRDALLDGFEVLVENDRIKEVSDRPIAAGSAIRIDLSGKTHDLLQPLPLARDG